MKRERFYRRGNTDQLKKEGLRIQTLFSKYKYESILKKILKLHAGNINDKIIHGSINIITYVPE